jgi:putative DNA primase/helicase
MIDQGLRISKRQQAELARYILDSETDVRVTLANRIGWHRIGDNDVFVLPGQVIGKVTHRVVYEGDGQGLDEYGAKGTLDDWRQSVSILAGNHELPALAISASFAGPLLQLAGQESGGIHFFGNSSTGKTTLLKLAASVWGDGGLVRSWRATSNGSREWQIAPATWL